MERPDFGTRFQFPENIHIEYDGLCGNIQNEIAVRMAEKYEDFVVQQIAMEARAEGKSFGKLAQEYGVHKRTIQDAVSGKNWGFLPQPPKGE